MESSRIKMLFAKLKKMDGVNTTHDMSHALRVARYAEEISGGKNRLKWEMLHAMCLLHDFKRIEGDMEGVSVAKTCEGAARILNDCGFSEDEKKMILNGIKKHSLISVGGITGKFEEPQTLEEKILFDADKLDALGPTGIVRWFATTSARGMPLEESAKLYLKIALEFETAKGGLYTDKGNLMGQKRLRYSRKFFRDLLKDLEGRKT